MEGREVERRLLELHSLRVGAEMGRYAARRLGEKERFAVIGDDARTGVARRVEVNPAAIAGQGDGQGAV